MKDGMKTDGLEGWSMEMKFSDMRRQELGGIEGLSRKYLL